MSLVETQIVPAQFVPDKTSGNLNVPHLLDVLGDSTQLWRMPTVVKYQGVDLELEILDRRVLKDASWHKIVATWIKDPKEILPVEEGLMPIKGWSGLEIVALADVFPSAVSNIGYRVDLERNGLAAVRRLHEAGIEVTRAILPASYYSSLNRRPRASLGRLRNDYSYLEAKPVEQQTVIEEAA